jgi:hypothetical protein
MRRRRLLAVIVTSIVVLLVVGFGVVVLAIDARAASAPIPPFPPQSWCPPEIDDRGEQRMNQVGITVAAMLDLAFDNPTDIWIAKVPADTRRQEIGDYYDARMSRRLRADYSFPYLGVEYDLWVWSYDGWVNDRAIAVVLLWELGVPENRRHGFKWLLVIDSNLRSKLDAQQLHPPKCATSP